MRAPQMWRLCFLGAAGLLLVAPQVQAWTYYPEPSCEEKGDCPPSCGNGVVEEGEDCDPPEEGVCSEGCMDIPPPPGPSCGDGVIEGNEQCDPPVPGECSRRCKIITPPPPDDCGNGVIDEGEECEPPGTDACSDDCKILECPTAPDCPACPPAPDCPDCPDEPDCPVCEPCPAPPPDVPPPEPECGDGIIQEGEDCEPPGVGGCTEDCQVTPVPECGDGIVEPPEDCEPPNVGTCDENCKIPPEPECGDGLVQPPEECEPPNVGTCGPNCTIDEPPPPPPPPAIPCVDCESKDGGKPTEITLQWLESCGAPPAAVSAEDNFLSYDPTTGILVLGGEDKLKSEIELTAGGPSGTGPSSIHASCSAGLGPGVRTRADGVDKDCQDNCSCTGCFIVVEVIAENGAPFCDYCPEI